MGRYARAAAALFGLVTGLIGLLELGASIAASGAYGLALVPLLLLSAAYSALLAVGSAAVLARGDGARMGGRVAGVLLAAAALAYAPLVVVTSPDVAIGAVVPGGAALILLVTTRDRNGSRAGQVVAGAARIGRVVLLGVGIAALLWSAVQLAGMAGGGPGSGLAGYGGVSAGITLAGVHAAFAVATPRFASGALLAAGALDVVLGFWAVPTGQIFSALGALLVAGLVLLALAAANEHRRRRRAPALP
jgi:hypothetical protein